jgi:hypothetical protein
MGAAQPVLAARHHEPEIHGDALDRLDEEGAVLTHCRTSGLGAAG